MFDIIGTCTGRTFTLSGSFIEPFPLIYTRQPVEASTRFNEFPLGPRSRPTKLNYKFWSFSTMERNRRMSLDLKLYKELPKRIVFSSFGRQKKKKKRRYYYHKHSQIVYLAYIWIAIYRNLQPQYPLHKIRAWAWGCCLPLHVHALLST